MCSHARLQLLRVLPPRGRAPCSANDWKTVVGQRHWLAGGLSRRDRRAIMEMEPRATSLRLCSMSVELPPKATLLFVYQHLLILVCMQALVRLMQVRRLRSSHAVFVVAPSLWIALPSTNQFARKQIRGPGLFFGRRTSECIRRVALAAIQSQGAARCNEITQLLAAGQPFQSQHQQRPSGQPHLEVLLLRQDGLGTGVTKFESYGGRCVLQDRPPASRHSAAQLCGHRTHQGKPDLWLGVAVALHPYLLLARREAAEATPAAHHLGEQRPLDVSP